MKKRNVLVTALAMALVAVVSVSATLAYFTAKTGAVKNTFTFAGNGPDGEGAIEVDVEELKPEAVADEVITAHKEEGKEGWNYENLVPGQTVNKKPTVSVKTSVDAYVFARVKVGANVSVKEYNAEWKFFEDTENGYRVMYKEVEGQKDTVQELNALFSEAVIGTDNVDIGTIDIEVAAIQKVGFDDAQAAYNELKANGFQQF